MTVIQRVMFQIFYKMYDFYHTLFILPNVFLKSSFNVKTSADLQKPLFFLLLLLNIIWFANGALTNGNICQ